MDQLGTSVGLRIYAYFPAISPLLFFVDAPHGRFNPSNNPEPRKGATGWLRSLWTSPKVNLDGQRAWIMMELPTLIIFCWTFWSDIHTQQVIMRDFPTPSSVLSGLYAVHYVNRALISPLRTTSRSPSHIAVLASAILFNTLNASLIYTYIGALRNAPISFAEACSYSPAFLSGLFIFIAGLISNVWHDEVLLRLRKTPNRKDSLSKGRYKVPHGGLYRFIS